MSENKELFNYDAYCAVLEAVGKAGKAGNTVADEHADDIIAAFDTIFGFATGKVKDEEKAEKAIRTVNKLADTYGVERVFEMPSVPKLCMEACKSVFEHRQL